ncbi:hypothetical protein ACFY3N_15785 [Streptomyces sp. NPDC000348]|uniref:hypothetical protein n=1 Tax=Streptomyces sp. NPDC000348 TaxID=3364538 RepID=UPI003695183A
MVARSGVLGVLTGEQRERLMPLAHGVPFAAGERHGYDAAAVRAPCGNDPVPAHAAAVMAGRLGAARVRLPGLYAPRGAGEVP